jgi:Flp pilus assembly protein TadG
VIGIGRRDRGQALTEFALVAPVFFLLVFGVLQLGLLFGGQNGLVNAAREVARYAATYRPAVTDPSAACNAVDGQIAPALARSLPGFDPTVLVPRVEYHWLANPGGTSYSMTVSVDIAYGHPLFVPLIGTLLDAFDGRMDGRLELRASEQMRVESPPLPVPADPSVPLAVCP